MKIEYKKSLRIEKMLVNGKHVKSFPLSISDYVRGKITPEHIEKFSKGKRLSAADCDAVRDMVFPMLLEEFRFFLKVRDKYAFELIKDSGVIGTRRVNVRGESIRFEICFGNHIKATCNESLHKFSPNKLPTANLNY